MVLPVLLSDATANDSNKSFEVPVGYIYEILYGQVTLVTSATAGNRQMVIQILDDDDVEVATIRAGAVQAASTTRYYEFVQGVPRETSFIDESINVAIPDEFIALPEYTVVIKDTDAIDAAADDMTVKLMVRKVRRF
jgi:hypothetical protein